VKLDHDRHRTAVGLIAPLAALSFWAAVGQPARAAPLATPFQVATISDLNVLSLEELSNIEVTSVSKAPERLGEAPAAIYVITREDIRRSGATSLPEALRLAPNLEVARQNAASYAITARGFNSPQSGNKLLVLIDGRSVYTPMASTVFWETLDVALADIERIEVVSGPGGTLWGANAVNGVINVITRSAADTQGAAAEVGGGDRDRNATLRFGGKLGDKADFRISALAFNRGPSLDRKRGDQTSDGARGVQGGFRVDGDAGAGSFTLQGDAYRNTVDLLDYRLTGQNLLGRWTRPLSARTSFTVQAYYDHVARRYQVADDLLRTFDVQAQMNTELGKRHRLVWGGEFRAWRSAFYSKVGIGFPKAQADLTLANGFVQDEIDLTGDLKLTLGLKLENNSYSGLDYLPNARLAWQAGPDTLLWTAVSRSVRTPSRIDRELSFPPFLLASPDFASEKLTAYEAGYRAQLLPQVSLSVSTFYNVYDDLRTTELTPSKTAFMLQNGLRGHTYGLEAWAKYSPLPSWRLSAGVDTLTKRLVVKPGHTDLSNLQAGGQDPSYQASLRSEMNLSPAIEFDVAVRRVGLVSPSNVPAYTEADMRLGWRVKDGLELSLDGRNLLHDSHLEVINKDTAPATPIPRSVYLSLRWGF
jgi:iron complex outermembrane receptor protein